MYKGCLTAGKISMITDDCLYDVSKFTNAILTGRSVYDTLAIADHMVYNFNCEAIQ